MRKLGTIRTFIASLCFPGIGYMYVGQLKMALMLMATLIGAIFGVSWTRLILEPWSVYLVAVIVLGTAYITPFHAAWIAFRLKQAPARRYNRWWAYSIYIVSVVVIFVFLTSVRGPLLGYEPFRIPGASMAPTVLPGEFIMADTWTYREAEPQVGAIVVFHLDDTSGTKYLKRVVAGPNDTVHIEDGVLFVNDKKVVETYLHKPNEEQPYGRNLAKVRLGQGQFFLLGDFRDNSKDSRAYGPIRGGQIEGQAIYIWYSSSDDDGIRWKRFPRKL